MEDLNWLHRLGVSTFIFISLYYFVNCLVFPKRRSQPLPPGPWPLPVIGHLHLLRKPLQRTFQSLSARYGPVFGLKLGNQYAIVVSSPAAVEDCFLKNDVVLADRRPMLSAKHLHYDSTTIGASNYGDHWRNIRRISNQEVFSVSRQNMFLSVRQEEVKSMIMSLFRMTSGQGKQKVEMKSSSDELTFNIVVRIVIGKRYCSEGVEDSEEAREFLDIIHEMVEVSAVSNLGDFIPFCRLIDFGNLEKKMVKLKKRVDVVLQNLINESRSMGGGGVAQSMLSNILTLQETDYDASLSDNTIKGLMLMLITAGTETTAATIEWAMSLLLNNPEKLMKARLEIDSIISPGRLVEEQDILKLTYLQAIVNETLRLYPPAPILAPHYSSGECTIQGFHVPRGTMVFTNAWAIHRDPEVWKDPLSFKPERFACAEDSHCQAYKLIPFGIGRRSCPGASMAHKVVSLALASLIQCFDWKRVGDEEVDMREGDGISMPKLIPLEAMCQPRNNMLHVLSRLA